VVSSVLHGIRTLSGPPLAAFVVLRAGVILASLPKFLEGGWIPVSISAVIVVISLTWLEGRRCLAKALAEQQTPIETVLEKLPAGVGQEGTMVFLTPDPSGVPFLARHRWVRERAQEERIVVLNIARSQRPYLTTDEERVTIERLSLRLVRIIARFGYMEAPRIDPIMRSCDALGLQLDRDDTSFFYADPKIEAAPAHGMPGWRRELYATMQRNSRPLPDDLRIKAERRIELGVTVEI